MIERPLIKVEAVFLPSEDGGRMLMPDISSGIYWPHLVVQPPDVRKAVVVGNVGVEDYLGVAFVDGPKPVVTGRLGRFTVRLPYYPKIAYEALDKGATFTIREGSRVVGYGTVVGRTDEADQ